MRQRLKEDIKKKGKKEELEDLENKVEITQQVSAKQPPLSCLALSTIIVLFRFVHAQRQHACRLPLLSSVLFVNCLIL